MSISTTWNPIGWRMGVSGEHGGARDMRMLNLPLGAVIQIVVFSLTTGGVFWASTSGMRSDVRDIRTQMEAAAKQADLLRQLNDERLNTMRETVNDQKRRLELLQYEVQGLKEMMLKRQGGYQ